MGCIQKDGFGREKMSITAFEVCPGKASVLRKLIEKLSVPECICEHRYQTRSEQI